ncbi:MAG: CRISPR-associated HD domain-containing [Desulfobulbaceae bacterium]|nr:MAG: CRISPR-associated HD domain-containing [Desulfobulbaceae bacterium]
MQYFARSASTGDDIPSQSYLEHVLHVLVRSRCYLRKVLFYSLKWDAATVRRILELAAEYHDLGKLVDENQRVLAGETQAGRLPIPHADAGVAHLIHCDAWFSALLVFAHHAGLPDFGEINVRGIRNPHIEHQIDQALPELLSRHEVSVRPAIRIKDTPNETPLLKPADVRMLFSCLVHADHGDAARATNQVPQRNCVPKLRATERLTALRRYIKGLSVDGDVSERNRMRSDFFETCSSGMCEHAIAICDAPVGTGKTTAVMSYLLSMAARHNLRRIFVILPFTNIITQSVQVYRKALILEGERAEDVVAEIHHRADFESLASRKLTALWDAPIIITTAVAFFETLASASPSTLRRLQNLPGSAVFLDEAHAMLSVKLLPLAWQWIKHAAEFWACRWVLASGSLCQFWGLEEFGEVQLPNLLPVEEQDRLKQFEISRVRHRYRPERMSLDDLAIWLKDLDGPVLVVLNTVYTAAAAARAAERVFGEGNVLHLSTSLTPEDREITLDLVRARLRYKAHTQWCLFATSCVEAGVDLSFRTGVRECASLLSLLQLAGRVNRNSEHIDADVWTVLLSANDSGVRRNPSLACSERILCDFFEQDRVISPELSTEAMKKEMREQGTFTTQLSNDENIYAFKVVEKGFKVIEDESLITVVNQKLLSQIRNYEEVSWQEIQNGSVRIRKNICERLKIEESQRFPGVMLWFEGAKYSSFLGYMEAVLDLDDFDKAGCAII